MEDGAKGSLTYDDFVQAVAMLEAASEAPQGRWYLPVSPWFLEQTTKNSEQILKDWSNPLFRVFMRLSGWREKDIQLERDWLTVCQGWRERDADLYRRSLQQG